VCSVGLSQLVLGNITYVKKEDKIFLFYYHFASLEKIESTDNIFFLKSKCEIERYSKSKTISNTLIKQIACNCKYCVIK
jgi:hypothetical protein